MLILLSPAKKLDYESESLDAAATEMPRLMPETEKLVAAARKLKASDLKAMMGVSDAIADLNVARFKAFDVPFTTANARAAIDAFKGDVYVGLDAPTLSAEDRSFADDHVRILSGLYGLLRPLDLMQAYRLEMGTKFRTAGAANLYDFWGTKITELLNADVAAVKAPALVNLASNEYFKSVKPKALSVPVITPVFKEIKEGRARVISFMAKKARGLMTRYAVDGRLTDPEALKAFDVAGYAFSAGDSDDKTWVFTRPQPAPAKG